MTSPILLKPIAENELLAVALRLLHVAISEKLIKPTISQQSKSKKRLRQFNTAQTENKNATSFKVK
jgi:hypothetical protein